MKAAAPEDGSCHSCCWKSVCCSSPSPLIIAGRVKSVAVMGFDQRQLVITRWRYHLKLIAYALVQERAGEGFRNCSNAQWARTRLALEARARVGEYTMAKGQERSNKDVKKPKQEEKTPSVVSIFEKGTQALTGSRKKE